MGATESRNERFYQCCGLGKAHLVERMLESDKQYNTINVNWVSFDTKSTPLLISCANGHDKVVDLLLNFDANPNVKDSHQCTSLHHAAQRGYVEILKKLIHVGCDLNTRDQQGWTALMKACYWCQPDAAMILLEAGSNVSIRNLSDRTALHEVCRSPVSDREADLAEIAMALLETGCEQDQRANTEGELTPLMYAAYHNHLDIALVLIEFNSNLGAVDQQGWTALHWACDRDNPQIVQLLLDKGSSPLAECNAGTTAVMRAKSEQVRRMFIIVNKSNEDDISNSELSSEYGSNGGGAVMVTDDPSKTAYSSTSSTNTDDQCSTQHLQLQQQRQFSTSSMSKQSEFSHGISQKSNGVDSLSLMSLDRISSLTNSAISSPTTTTTTTSV